MCAIRITNLELATGEQRWEGWALERGKGCIEDDPKA